MDIEEALKLKKGDRVYYPPDRGDPKGYGIVHTTPKKRVYENIHGRQYIWVSVHTVGKTSVWPSNRLSRG